jgi:hypothetical protein
VDLFVPKKHFSRLELGVSISFNYPFKKIEDKSVTIIHFGGIILRQNKRNQK